MRVSLNWIKEFTSIDIPLDELVELISRRLVEVEEVINWGAQFKDVVVGQITDARPHPSADKLGVYKVKIGHDVRQLVAGDKTLKPGDKVGYIPPGAIVPNTFYSSAPVTITEVTLRGEQSQGMLGSARELLFSQDHSGVAKLDTDVEPGTSLLEAYDLDDWILDIENKSFTHRPDCFGILGLAREIAGIQGVQFSSPQWFLSNVAHITAQNKVLPLEVDNQVPDLAPRYMAVALSGVTIQPSPLMVQSMLTRMGVRPLNNVVDVTNYMMLLSGQPLHAFDYDKVQRLQGGDEEAPVKLIVRQAGEVDESLALLDGKVITPRPGALLIATQQKPLALAGIMGGVQSEIDNDTVNIIIEVATFDMYNLRSTSMRHGIFSEALTRYAKGPSPHIPAPVLARSTGMLLELMPGVTISSPLVDIYPHPKNPSVISFGSDWLNHFIGTQLKASDITKLLGNVEFTVQQEGEALEVQAPLWRSDIAIAEDIADEVGRLYGFDNIPLHMPQRDFHPVMSDELRQLKRQLRDLLVHGGANDILTHNFVSQKLLQQTSQDTTSAYHLANSISPELAYWRTNLTASLLAKIVPNIRAGEDEFALFEINKTHSREEIGEDKLPIERQSLALVYAADAKHYDAAAMGSPFYRAKFYLEEVLSRVGVDDLNYRLLRVHTLDSVPVWLRLRVSMYDLNRSALIIKDQTVLGVIGEPDAQTRRTLKLPAAVGMFECDLVEILGARSTASTYQPPLKFPATEQDMSFRVGSDLLYKDLVMFIRDFLQKTELHFSMEPVDIFQRPNIPDQKHITVRVRLQHPRRTLTLKEVNELLDTLSQRVREALHGERI